MSRHPRILAASAAAAVALASAAFGGGAPASAASPTAARLSAAELTIVPSSGAVLYVGGRPYAGNVVLAPDGGGLAVVNRLPFERYLDGLAEVPSSWPGAALQAQAVAGRTYALWKILTSRPGPGGGQICATDACQVYAGMAKEQGPGGANWVAAVSSTAGQVLLWDGRVVEAVYGSSDGGQTTYGGVPWLPAVDDPQDSIAPEHHWAWSAPVGSLAGALGVGAPDTLTSLVSSSQAITGTVQHPDGSTSTVSWSPAAFRADLDERLPPPSGLDMALPSWRYSVSTANGQVAFDGYGDGNGLGLSQYGALGKALQGWSAARILASYYGAARPTLLPSAELPATIGVTLASGAARAQIASTGPVQILDGSGKPLAGAPAGSTWTASAGGGGVTLAAGAGGFAPVPVAAPAAVAVPLGAMVAPAARTSPTVPAPRNQSPVEPPAGAAAPGASLAAEPVPGAELPGAASGGRPLSSRPAPVALWASVGLLLLLVVSAGLAAQIPALAGRGRPAVRLPGT